MRGGPELRITGNVTTVNADTSVVITEQLEETMDLNQGATARVVTVTQVETDGWAVGEKVEVVVKSLERGSSPA